MTRIPTPILTLLEKRAPPIGWLSAGLTLAAITLAVLTAPTPAHAEKACCCKQDVAQGCTEVQLDSNGVETCPPDFPNLQPGLVPDDGSCETLGDLQREAGGVMGERSWISTILPRGEELIPQNCRIGPQPKDKPCTILDMVRVLVNVTKLMLAVLGSVAFAMFVYGGFVWLTSAGSPEAVNKGKTILRNAALGILVVFISWTVANFVVAALSLGRGGVGELGNIFNQQWTKGP